MIRDKQLLNRLSQIARAKRYTLRDTQTLLEIEGFKRPSLDFIWRFFKASKKKRVKRIL